MTKGIRHETHLFWVDDVLNMA